MFALLRHQTIGKNFADFEPGNPFDAGAVQCAFRFFANSGMIRVENGIAGMHQRQLYRFVLRPEAVCHRQHNLDPGRTTANHSPVWWVLFIVLREQFLRIVAVFLGVVRVLDVEVEAGLSHSNDMHFLRIFRKVVHVQ